MTKAGKITLISLGSLLLLVAVAIAVVCNIVFTPKKITPIVRNMLNDKLDCEVKLDTVELVFFSTFPHLALDIDNVALINPVEGAPSDVLAKVDNCKAKLNLMDLIKRKELVVNHVMLSNGEVNIYISPDSVANYDIYTSTSEDNDTLGFPLKLMQIEGVKLTNVALSYHDCTNNLHAVVDDLSSLNAALNWQKAPGCGNAKVKLESKDIKFASGDTTVINVVADALTLDVDASFKGDDYEGVVALNVPALSLSYDSVEYVANKSLTTKLPVKYNAANSTIALDDALVDINGQAININGAATMGDSYDIDASFTTPQWNIEEVLKLVPEKFASMLKDINAKGDIEIASGRVYGVYNDSTMPMIDANVKLHTAEFKYSSFPYTFKNIDADVVAAINLNDSSLTQARINKLAADVLNSHLVVDGVVENVINDARLLLNVDGNLQLPDVHPILPETMNIKMKGKARAKLKTDILLSQITNSRWEKMKINGPIDASQLNIVYNDSIIVDTDKAHIDLEMPSKAANKRFKEFLQTAITCKNLKADIVGTGKGELENSKLIVGISNPLKDEAMSLRVDYAADDLKANTDTFVVAANMPKGSVYMQPKDDATAYEINYHSQALNVQGGEGLSMSTKNIGATVKAVYDTTKEAFLDRWQPVVTLQLNKGNVKADYLTMDIDAPRLDCFFSKRQLIVNKTNIVIGGSDFTVEGAIHNIERWMKDEGLLTGEINLTSKTTDVYELMDFVSGLGGDEEQTLEATQGETENPNDNPFMVPWGTDLTLKTNIHKVLAGDSEFNSVKGNLRVKDGVLVLDEMGFTCDAATMQLTALYRSPRRNHLFLGMNFHLLNIDIDKLIDMIPEIDTIVPMLSSFKGKAEFHLAAETYLKSDYTPKYSTLRGAASIDGQDLVLMDSKTFAQISKLLMFNRKTENKVDSLSLEMTIFRNEVELYPFLIQMDKYKAVVAGRYDLTPHYDAHIETLAPIRLAVKVGGDGDDYKFKLTKTQYANMYKPEKRNAVQERVLALKKLIADALKATVKDEEYFQ